MKRWVWLALVGCGSSDGPTTKESGDTFPPIALVACPAELPTDLAPGIALTGELEGAAFAWSCAPERATTLHQKVGDGGTQDAFNGVCVDPATEGRLSFWVQGVRQNAPFTVRMPSASTFPNLTAQVTLNGKELEQDSFEIDADHLIGTSAIVWAIDGRFRLRGCLEAAFKGSGTKSAGNFKVLFDMNVSGVAN